MSSTHLFTAALLFLTSEYLAEGRQMCYTCQYTFTETKQGYECVNDPKNITRGQYAAPCKLKCIIQTRTSSVNDELLMYMRGCGYGYEKNECVDIGGEETCFYTCEDNFCNGADIREELKDLAVSNGINIVGIFLGLIANAVLWRF